MKFDIGWLTKVLLPLVGVTGLLTATSFAVEKSHYSMLGIPKPPLAISDYVASAGALLYDVTFRILLVNAVLLLVAALLVVAGPWLVWATLRARLPALFSPESVAAKLTQPWRPWISRLLATVLLVSLVWITLDHHIPVLAQKNLAVVESPALEPATVQRSRLVFLGILVPDMLIRRVEAKSEWVQEILSDEVTYPDERFLEFRNIFLFVALATACGLLINTKIQNRLLGNQAQSEIRNTSQDQVDRQLKGNMTWEGMVDGMLRFFMVIFLVINVLVIPVDYGVLLRSREFPRVTLELTSELRGSETGLEKFEGRIWYLIHEDDHELRLYGDKKVHTIPRDAVLIKALLTPQSLMR